MRLIFMGTPGFAVPALEALADGHDIAAVYCQPPRPAGRLQHRAVMAGDAETGICIMRMEPGLDTGPVLLRESTPIGAGDTTGDLHDRLAAMGARLAVAAMARLEGLVPAPQPEVGVTYAHKIDKTEARIDWTRPAEEVDRHIRGLSPFPGAWCDGAGGRLKILRSRVAPGAGTPGTVIVADAGRLVVACGTGAVEVLEAQREGRRPMPTSELLRGLSLRTGDALG